MDGLEAAAKIMELNTGIPIVAMTANVMVSDVEIYKMSGMQDFVGKPFTSQELWHCLIKYFRPLTWQNEDKGRYAQEENELRQKLINNFVENSRTKFSEIVEAINADDIKLAHRLAHTLKSNAGQLGKTLLQNSARDVEENLKDGKNNVTQQQMIALERELNAALAELTPLVNDLSRSGGSVFAEPLDTNAARELVEKLKPVLESNNLDCLKFIESLRRIPGCEELIQHIEGFDFDQALDALIEWQNKGIR
jgi:HPt (histidine-containing phosphotransfer) domain-containing protein